MAINFPIETNVMHASSIPAHSRTLRERGVLHFTLQVDIRDAGGVVSSRTIVLPTNMPILSRLQPVFDDTLKFGPLIRSQLGPGHDAHFVLVDRDHHIVGCVSLDMAGLSDRDLAWINCLLAESLGAVLAFFGSMPHEAACLSN